MYVTDNVSFLAAMQVLLRDKMNVLLLLLPLAIVSHAVSWPAGVTFVLAVLPLCSLAEVGGCIAAALYCHNIAQHSTAQTFRKHFDCRHLFQHMLCQHGHCAEQLYSSARHHQTSQDQLTPNEGETQMQPQCPS